MANTPWIDDTGNKLELQSGQFTSTIKDSEDVTAIETAPLGITYDGTNTPWIGSSAYKLYLTSGNFTSTLKDSEDITAIGGNTYTGISWDGTDTPFVNYVPAKLYLSSGQFTTTIKDSENVTGIDTSPQGISTDDNGHTPWMNSTTDKLMLTSGQFTSTIKASEGITTIDDNPSDISYTGTDTLWSGNENKKLFLQSGQFTSTVKTSEDVSGVSTNLSAICTDDVNSRLGAAPPTIYEPSVLSSITFGQVIASPTIYTRSLSNTITLGHSNAGSRVTSHSIESTLIFGQIPASQTVDTTVYIYNDTTFSHIVFSHDVVSEKVFGLPATEACRLNIPRWIYASVSKYFSTVAANNNLHFYLEGTHRQTDDYQEYIEFRMEGPNFTQVSKNVYYIDIEINILWSFNQDDVDFHETERLKGILIDAMRDICVYRYGDGVYDDDSLVNTLQLRQDTRIPIGVNNFGQIRPDVRLMQGTVEGKYRMIHSC